MHALKDQQTTSCSFANKYSAKAAHIQPETLKYKNSMQAQEAGSSLLPKAGRCEVNATFLSLKQQRLVGVHRLCVTGVGGQCQYI